VTAHIVHVVHRFDTGGMENGMVNLFNALPPQRYRHTVVALTDYRATGAHQYAGDERRQRMIDRRQRALAVAVDRRAGQLDRRTYA